MTYIPGTVLLWAAALLSIASTVGFVLASRGRSGLEFARQCYTLMTVAVSLASVVLMYLILNHDYRLQYVYGYSDNALPLNYLVSTFWAGQEGSFLLWALCAALIGLFVQRTARRWEPVVMVVYNLTLVALLVLLVKQDPFRFHEGLTAGTVPTDGRGLNPLLQNPWMVIHPPIMFVGYAAAAVPFAYAAAALIKRAYDDWVRPTMGWILVSFATLAAGIMLGAYWSYETLGWGGYWAWDPVENASLVPWLITAALAHGVLIQRWRTSTLMRRLNIAMALAAHLFVVYATFLTRSGILADFSVHSFVDLGITGWLMLELGLFLVGAIGLLAWRWFDMRDEGFSGTGVSRSVFLLLGTSTLVALGLIVLIGTSTPLLTRMAENPSQVGPGFYNSMGQPFVIVFGLLLGLTPFLDWKGLMARGKVRLWSSLTAAAVLTVVGAVAGVRDPVHMAMIAAASFGGVANLIAVGGWLAAGRWRAMGGALAHVGFAMMLIGFVATGGYSRSQAVSLPLDETREVLGYSLTFTGVDEEMPDGREATVVQVGESSETLYPRLWVNEKSNQMVANPAISSSLLGDLYLAPNQLQPPEAPDVSATIDLVVGEPVVRQGRTVTLERFNVREHDEASGHVTVEAQIAMEQGGETVQLMPALVSDGGHIHGRPAAMPDGEGQVRILGLSIERQQARVQLLGLGGAVAATHRVAKGESFTYDGVPVRFDRFAMSRSEHQAGQINVGVEFTVGEGEAAESVTAVVTGGMEAGTTIEPAPVPGRDGVELRVNRIDAEQGMIEVEVFDASLPTPSGAPLTLVLEVSRKPLILLIWIGTILVLLGTALAFVLRWNDLFALSESSPQ